VVIFTLLLPPAAAQITKVVNAASFTSNNTFVPGTIITIRGNNLANTTASASDPLQPPKTLGGVTVSVGGVQSVLFYVSPTQINTQVPTSVTTGAKTLSLSSPAGTFTAQIEIVQAGSPGIFSLGGTGTGEGAILNAVTFDRGPFSVTTLGQPTYLAVYATGLDLTSIPKVTINGVSLPVLFAGWAPGFTGLQQINVKLLDQLAGAGRVDMMITTGGKTTNVVEIVIVPSPGQGPFAPSGENQSRSRELAALAWVRVAGVSLALLTDENDDVVRVIDIQAKKVIRTIALAEGAEPVAIAVDAAGTMALVAERGRDRAAVLNLANFTVSGEIPLGPVGTAASGPVAVSIVAANVGLVANSDTDNVSVLNLPTASSAPGTTATVIGLVKVGRAPRGIGSGIGEKGELLAYVTNQSDGTISVIDVVNRTVLKTLELGVDVRPQSILILPLPWRNIAVVTEPSSRETGRVMLVDLNNGAILADVDVNPDRSGGSSDIAFFNNTVYFANQSAGSVTAAPLSPPPPSTTPPKFTSETTIKAGIGARALAIDAFDKLLLVTNQGSGEVVLIDLETNKIVDRINGVRGEMEVDGNQHDDHGDRSLAANAPAITSLTPSTGKAGTSFSMTISGKNFTGATEVIFVDPDKQPGRGNGNGNSSGHGNGPSGGKDAAFTVSGLKVDSASHISISVAIAANASKGDRVVQVLTPNGESSLVLSQTNKFTVE
jgi:uncharacterized protein (TIGR03437 family)